MKNSGGKEMTAYLMRFLSEATAWTFDSTPTLKKLGREFHCHRLNCVIAIVSCTSSDKQKLLKLSNAYIFKEIREKDQLIWSRIVDVDKTIALEMVLEKNFGTRKDFVAVQQSYNEVQGVLLAAQSHYLSDSSLSQDVSR